MSFTASSISSSTHTLRITVSSASKSPSPSPTFASFPSTSPSTTPSSPTTPSAVKPTLPNYKSLERLLLALITLARKVYRPSFYPSSRTSYHIPHRSLHYLTYTQLHARLASFAARNANADFATDKTWGWVVECAVLLHLVEIALGGPRQGEVKGLEGCTEMAMAGKQEQEKKVLGCKVEADEWNKEMKGVNMTVDCLIFRGMELNCKKLPWNLKENNSKTVR